LKYEVYGILIITISIIALSGEAAVGRALSKLFGLFLGKFYFALAICGVLFGLAVMIKRSWPNGWSTRKTGFVILVMALTLSSSISQINSRYMGIEDTAITGQFIMKTLDTELRTQLFMDEGSEKWSIQEKSISGGYVGALQFSLLFMLFGYYGALIMNIVMYLIAIMLITGKSYVEMIRIIKVKITRFIKLFIAKIAMLRARRQAIAKVKAQPQYIDDDDDDEEEPLETIEATVIKPKKKSYFFKWKAKKEQMDDELDEWELSSEVDQSRRGYDADSENVDEIVQVHETVPLTAQEKDNENIFEHTPNAHAFEDSFDQVNDQAKSDLSEYNSDDYNWEQHVPDDTIAEMDHGDELDKQMYDYPEGQEIRSDALITESDLDSNLAGQAEPIITEIPYELPPFTILNKPSIANRNHDGADMYDSRRKLEATLESFGVRAKVLEVVRGPAVTRYEVQPATGVKVNKIVSLTDDIALALAAKDVRMEAPIPGKSAIGIEVPNGEVSVVTMREVMETPVFINAASKVSIAFGRDISGQTIVGNLAKMPHLLVAGATGSGKSVCINGIIASILYKATPEEVKFLMIDPKMVELNVYNGIPHLLAPVVTNPKQASMALKKVVVEMEKRYELFSKSGTRNIEGYNQHVKDNPDLFLPYIVVIVDELADLMMVASNDVEDAIARLAQMARAAGIHLIIATQRPSVDVITGVIKANIPSRIAFGVSSQVDSRTILDVAGAEKLLGRGDMLFLPMGMSKPIRVQGAFLSDEEVEALVSFVSRQGEVQYNEDIVPPLEDESGGLEEVVDDLFEDAVKIVLEGNQASVSLLQRRLRVGYTRAARLIDELEAQGIVGPYEGSKPRTVLISLEQWNVKQQTS